MCTLAAGASEGAALLAARHADKLESYSRFHDPGPPGVIVLEVLALLTQAGHILQPQRG